MRPSWDDYFMSIAYVVSTRATCDRKMVGAVIVDEDNEIMATGYNGAPSGMLHCDEAGHEIKNIDGRDSCIRTLHAESNAIDFATHGLIEGCTLYVTTYPCYECAKRIVNAQFAEVIYSEYYTSRSTELVNGLLTKAGIAIRQWKGKACFPQLPSDRLKVV